MKKGSLICNELRRIIMKVMNQKLTISRLSKLLISAWELVH